MGPYNKFALDHWIQNHSPQSKVSLHHSCVSPLTLKDLQAFDPTHPILDDDEPISYANVSGIPALRERIASLYDGAITADDVLVTSGAISANKIILETLLSAGDHVVVQHPTFNQLVELSERAGAELSFWKQHLPSPANANSWTIDVTELEALIRPNTKLIILNNPSNPTGLVLSEAQLNQITGLAASNGITLLSDEVFRFLHHDSTVPAPPSLLSLNHPASLVVGSVSKAFALPGLRIGWIAAHPSLRATLLPQFLAASDYAAIAISQVDQRLGAFALQTHVREAILTRGAGLAERNIALLSEWVQRNKEFAEFAIPQGGGTCLLRVLHGGKVLDDEVFARKLSEEERVCVPPASRCFGFQADGEGESEMNGFLRVGVVSKPGVLEIGLEAMERLLRRWEA